MSIKEIECSITESLPNVFPLDGLIPADAALSPDFFTDFQNGDYVTSQGFPGRYIHPSLND